MTELDKILRRAQRSFTQKGHEHDSVPWANPYGKFRELYQSWDWHGGFFGGWRTTDASCATQHDLDATVTKLACAD